MLPLVLLQKPEGVCADDSSLAGPALATDSTSRVCQGKRSCEISSSRVHWFVSYHVNKLFCPISQWWGIQKSSPVTVTLKFSGFEWLSRYMFVVNFTELSAVVHELLR